MTLDQIMEIAKLQRQLFDLTMKSGKGQQAEIATLKEKISQLQNQ